MSALPSLSGKISETYDIVVVSAGFAGVAACLYRLRKQGMTARVYEQGDGVGGTQYWNRYPGARCDVESMQYSLFVLGGIAAEMGLERALRAAARNPEIRQSRRRPFQSPPGYPVQYPRRADRVRRERRHLAGRNLRRQDRDPQNTSCSPPAALSNAKMPDIRGLDGFKGKVDHTGHWPQEEVDFTGLRVGVIGTGSSALQSVPIIAEQASQLTVFQRTPNFSIPARNAKLTADERQWFRQKYPGNTPLCPRGGA